MNRNVKNKAEKIAEHGVQTCWQHILIWKITNKKLRHSSSIAKYTKYAKQREGINTEELANDCCGTTKSDYVFRNCSCSHSLSSVRNFQQRENVKKF